MGANPSPPCYAGPMTREIDWEAVAKVEMRPGAPERPAEVVKAIARHKAATEKQTAIKPPTKRK